MTQQLLPDLPGFSIEQITIAHGVITVLARSQMTSGHCPECAHLLGKRATLIGIRSGELRCVVARGSAG